MRIRLILSKAGEHIVDWSRTIHDFPKLIRAHGRVYEHVMYDKVDEFGIVYECHFAEQAKGSAYPWETPVDLDVLLNRDTFYGCQCGAKFTSFPQIHMFFCRKYKPRD